MGNQDNQMHQNRVVIKVGTSTLAHNTGLVNLRRVEQLVRVIADVKNAGREVVLVSSGSIGIGAGKLGLKERPKDVPTRQACASVGQCELMYIYDKLFGQYNHTVAQVLLTQDVLDNEERRVNVSNTFERLLNLGVIPIVNENDAVSTEEIGIGDNDTLSAVVGQIVGAHRLVILTDIDGLYDKSPKEYPDAKLISLVEEIDDHIKAIAGGAGSSLGTGGMMTKVLAAERAMAAGFSVSIINGSKPDQLYDLMDGKKVGTLFKKRK